MVYNSVGYHSVCYIFLFTIPSALYKAKQQNIHIKGVAPLVSRQNFLIEYFKIILVHDTTGVTNRAKQLTDLTHIVMSFPQGQIDRNVTLNNVNSSFASLDFACLELLLLISIGFRYTFTYQYKKKLIINGITLFSRF